MFRKRMCLHVKQGMLGLNAVAIHRTYKWQQPACTLCAVGCPAIFMGIINEMLSECSTLGAHCAPARIEEVTLMRPFHGNL